MILEDELRISTDPTEVYLELLDRFGKEDLDLREKEDTGFVSLCLNDVFLERHWKKILRDVRYGALAASHAVEDSWPSHDAGGGLFFEFEAPHTGTLNRHLDLSKERRHQLSQRLYAKPKHASQLEEAFRRLGFHARSAERRGASPPRARYKEDQDTKSKNASMRWDQAISSALADPSKGEQRKNPSPRFRKSVAVPVAAVPDDQGGGPRCLLLDRSVRLLVQVETPVLAVLALSSRDSSYYDEVSEPTSRASSSNMGRSGTTGGLLLE